MDYKKRLSGMQGEAAEAMSDYKPAGSFAPVPDDDYVCNVKTTLEETRKAPPRLTVVWCFVVADGEFQGRQIWDRTIIEDNKVGLQICRRRVEQLGYEWPEENLGSLQDIVNDITDRCPSITARTRTNDDGEYTNTSVYIREVHDMPSAEEAAQPASEADAAPAEDAPPAEEAAAPEATADDQHKALLDFCASQGLDGITADMSDEDIITGIRDAKITFQGATLTQEEADMLTAVGGEDLVVWKKAVAPAAKAPAAKAPAAKAPAPAAKPVARKAAPPAAAPAKKPVVRGKK